MGSPTLKYIFTCLLKFLVQPHTPIPKHTEAGSLPLRVTPSFETGGSPDLPYLLSYTALLPPSLVVVLRQGSSLALGDALASLLCV